MACIDLHTHSRFSDGTLSPAAIVDLTLAQGLAAVAVTDHDTVEGVDEALGQGAERGLRILAGLEISAVHDGTPMHVLGYGIDHHQPGLLAWLNVIQQGRRRRNREIIAKLNGLGFALGEDELELVSGCGQVGRPHIARLLLDKGVVRSMDQAFSRYLRRGGAAYAARPAHGVDQAIAMIHAAGGLAVLAHPGQIDPSMRSFEEIFARLRAKGLDGIEVYHPRHDSRMRRKLLDLARRFQLLVTGGSDFHGDNKPNIELAHQGSPYPVPDELLAPLDAALAARAASCSINSSTGRRS